MFSDVGSNYGDVSGVIGELEIVKKRMLELEMDKLTIRQKIFEIRFALDQEEALFHAQFSAKDGALAYLKTEYEAMRKKFFNKLARAEQTEVFRYSKIVGDEEEIMKRKADRFESGDRKVVVGLSLTPMHSSHGEFTGWNIDEHIEPVH